MCYREKSFLFCPWHSLAALPRRQRFTQFLEVTYTCCSLEKSECSFKGQPYLNKIGLVAAESRLLVHVTLKTSKAMSAESTSSLSSHTCIKVNLDKVNILQLLNRPNLKTTADWDFLVLLVLLYVTPLCTIQMNNLIWLMKMQSNHWITDNEPRFSVVDQHLILKNPAWLLSTWDSRQRLSF